MSDGTPGRLVAILVVTLFASVVVVAGVWFVGSGGTATEPTFGTDAADRLASLDSLTATRETVIEDGSDTRRTVETVSMRPSTGAVRAIAETTPRQTDVRVSNGSVLWLYDRDADTVLRIDGNRQVHSLDRIPRLLAAVNNSHSANGTAPTVSPLPAVPEGDGGNVTGPAGDHGSYKLSYEGTDKVDGRNVHVFELGGMDGQPVANYSQRLWLDAEWYYPLKQRTAWTQGGERTVVTTTYSDVAFNPGLDDDRFEFDPPANATVKTPSDRQEREYDSPGTLREDAAMTVPEPTVPESFVFESGKRTTGRIDSIALTYVNATGRLSVSKLDTVIPPRTEGETLTVAGQEATYRNLGPTRSVVWSCDGVQYKVRGRGLSRETLVDVAGSVGCE